MEKLLLVIFALGVFGNALAALEFEKHVIEENILAGTASYDFVFKFKNEGETHIKITNIKTDCGCTVVKNEKDTYAPNESGEIKGTFTIGDRTGLQEKKIFIQTDNIGQSKIELLVKTQIEPLVTIKPSLRFWRIGSEATEKSVTITLSEEFKEQRPIIEFDKNLFLIEAISNTKNPCEMILKIKPLSTSKSVREIIKIKVNHDKDEKMFSVHAMIK